MAAKTVTQIETEIELTKLRLERLKFERQLARIAECEAEVIREGAAARKSSGRPKSATTSG